MYTAQRDVNSRLSTGHVSLRTVSDDEGAREPHHVDVHDGGLDRIDDGEQATGVRI